MRVGVAFPTTEIGNRPQDIKDFVCGAEDLGFSHLTCIDHVIQSVAPVAADWRAYYTRDNAFHEVLTLFGFMAAITERIELATAILILPQRPTVLVAKQLAEIDVLSNGRLRAGMGIGWNAIEFEALGQDFKTRARRMEEQFALLRRLWSEEVVHFDGRWDSVPGAGINPLPVRRAIPLWIGAFEPPAIARAGRIADGLFLNPRTRPGETASAHIRIFHDAAVEAGRDPSSLGLEVAILTEGRGANAIREEYEAWCEHTPSHLTLRTMTAGFTRVSQHLHALEAARRVID